MKPLSCHLGRCSFPHGGDAFSPCRSKCGVFINFPSAEATSTHAPHGYWAPPIALAPWRTTTRPLASYPQQGPGARAFQIRLHGVTKYPAAETSTPTGFLSRRFKRREAWRYSSMSTGKHCQSRIVSTRAPPPVRRCGSSCSTTRGRHASTHSRG
jgi:hypothetical protein